MFSALDESTRLELASQMEAVHIAAGHVLMTQGDIADGLYIVVSGRLRLSVETGGFERVLHDVGRGSIVGELALLSDRPRSATVRAQRDSDLLLLRASSFADLVHEKPAVLWQVVRLLTDRLLLVNRLLAVDGLRAQDTRARTLTIAQAGSTPGGAARVADLLTAQLAATGSVLRLDAEAVDRQLGPGAAQRGPDDPGRGEVTGWLHAAELDHDHVVYVADSEDTPWSRLCLSQSDLVLLAAVASGDRRLGSVESRALALGTLHCELVLLQASQPVATAEWLRHRPVAAQHHLRSDHPGDIARLARLITGTACGLVLGGGGPRGFAHLGVMRALDEAGVPIDVVGGTSIGAVMGSLYAQDLPDADRVALAVAALAGKGGLLRPTLPFVALSSARRVDELLEEHLGDRCIEDLERQFFCVSANLARAEPVIHETGTLWKAVRASLSMPGIFPPVYDKGDLLIDGGVLDNVPVATMRKRVGSGHIVAVDLFPDIEPIAAGLFENGFSGWRVLRHYLSRWSSSEQLPSILDILSRANGLSGVRAQRAMLADHQIDLLLRPPVARLGALDFKGGVRLIEVGYRCAIEALANSELRSRFAIGGR
jgi:predicted acylesterase/phospholipase RssA/CRP-like cAMP-binding protein